MSLGKIGMSLAQKTSAWVKAAGKTSVLQTKPIQTVNMRGLKYDTLELKNTFETKLKALLDNDCIQAGLSNTCLGSMNKSELYNYLKTRPILKNFPVESFHNDGLMDYIRSKNINIFKASKDEINKLVKKYFEAENKFYTMFDDALFPKSTNANAKKIEQQLEDFGINARLMNNEEIGKDILEACKKMKKAGIKSFPKIRVITNDYSSMGLPAEQVQDGFVFLSALKGEVRDLCINGGNQGTIFHETAHVIHKHLKAEHSMSLYANSDKAFVEIKPLLTKEVSIYACNNINEALSEIFTGLMSGKKFSSKIMEFYKTNGGYIPPNLK